jgi:hypothetical protein
MKIVYRVAAVAAGALVGVAALAGAASASPSSSNGSKSAFFTGGNGTASWENTNGSGQAIQLSSPDGNSYAGFVGHGIDGVKLGDITALSYDFRVTTQNWNSPGGGSPRLVVDLSDGGSIDLNPVTVLSSGTTWVHMDALSGAVDTNGGAGYGYQVTWNVAVADHPGATVRDAFVVNDSGWERPLTVQIANLTLDSSLYSHPATSNL